MANNYLRGALIQFMPTFLNKPVPNVILFQFNPETIAHTWSQPEGDPNSRSGPRSSPLAVRGLPGESFSFTIAMDAGDMIADGSPVAELIGKGSGIYSRLAALEMLLYPESASDEGLLGAVSLNVSRRLFGKSADASRTVPHSQLPAVLFVWGPGRIVPVRVTQLTITEKLYDSLLNPTHAEAQLELRVLTPEEFEFVSGPFRNIAMAAYIYSQGLRQTLAISNLANAIESDIGMIAAL